jgi:serine/threonine-protein kinase
VQDPITQRWSELEPLAKALLDVPAAEREAWLEQNCPDPTQRAAVLELVASDESVEGPLPRLCRQLASAHASGNVQIGPYRLIEKLGEGGMAVVYLAERDTAEFRQRVAIKLMRGDVYGRDQLALFQREQRLHARLEHPHIARVFDSGITEAGIPYFAMEFVDGERITHWCDARRLDIRKRLELFLLVCDAVQCAHANLIVHRDLKPSNILVTKEGIPKLLDFGIARPIHTTDGGPDDADPQTKTAIRFTPGYAAPEQLSGDTLSAATDVYALGILLHELLTGARPRMEPHGDALLASQTVSGLPEQKVAGIAEARATIPAALMRALHGDLDGILAKALRSEPERRYVDAREFAQDVRRQLSGEPIQARPDSFPYRLSRFLQRHRFRIVSGVAIVALLSLPVAGVLVWRLAPRALPEEAIARKSIAVLPFENLSEDKSSTYFASGMRDEILTRLAKIGDLKVISRTSTEKYASRPTNPKEVAKQLGVATLLEGSVQKVGERTHINVQLIDARDDSHLWAQSYDRDLKDVFAVERDVSEHIAQALEAKLRPEEAVQVAKVPTQNAEAYDLYLRGLEHFNRGDDYFVVPVETPQALTLYQQALDKDPDFALARAGIALAHLYMYWFAPDRTNARLEAAKAEADRALAAEPDLGDGHLALALYHYWGRHAYAEALQELDTARALMPNNARVETFTAAIARRQGRWEQSIAGWKRVALLDPRSSGPHLDLGATYAVLRRYAEVEKATARAAELSADPVTPRLRRAFNAVAWKGDLSEMRAAFQTPEFQNSATVGASRFMLAWWSRDFDESIRAATTDHANAWVFFTSTVLPRQLYAAWAYDAAGRANAAQEAYRNVYSETRAALRERPEDADLHKAAGLAAAGLGMKQIAIEQGEAAIAAMSVERDAISGPAYLDGLARIYVRVGEEDKAIEVLRKLLSIPAGYSVTRELLKLDPVWDPLRAKPAFQQLIAAQ